METITETPVQNNKKPLLFALWYGVALALLVFLFAAFTRTPQIRPVAALKEVDVKAEGERKLLEVDALLHSRLEKLQQARTTGLNKSEAEKDSRSFLFTLDSLEKKKTDFGASSPQLTSLIRYFKNAAIATPSLVKDTVRISSGINPSGEVASLRNAVQQKDIQLAELQRRLALQRPAAGSSPVNNSDLALRYDRLKATVLTIEDRNHILNREIRKLKQENEILQVSLKSRNANAPRN